MSVTDDYFEHLFEGNDDPWAFRQRWYEQRKRALTLAALPLQHYRSIFEPGCANGELSALLATRCDRLLACDTSARAVTLARQRLQDSPHATVMHGRLPQDWPSEKFDLIVFSEVGYYLDEADLRTCIKRMDDSLSDNGHLLACHWRPVIDGCPLDAEQVHRLVAEQLPLQRVCLHRETDFVLEVFARRQDSIAQQEFDHDRRADSRPQ
ncbi:nodulation S family protein [Pseudomonas sp. 21LCFQ02]|uniref:class I SAM-dependent DNA methyltransferase n=1 Tax=Pseudomonas sp. 21LCFQ02 TaxID=2957505 RepID=UPI00209A9108|nr:class I SAM-dependent methyltransferase [Pseudomonas sp. 21LCFQ02]MCO8168702.1 nodulation S family protein [Pseudomonas sp. 21LCFQ02]